MLLLPCFRPQYFNQFFAAKAVYALLGLFGLAYAALQLFCGRARLGRVARPLLGLWAYLFVWTILRGGNVEGAFDTFQLMAIMIVVLRANAAEYGRLLRVLLLHFELCVYLNLFTLIVFSEHLYAIDVYPYGVADLWFLGGKNNFVDWIYPAICVAALYRCENAAAPKKRARGAALILAALLHIALQYTATVTAGVAVFGLLCLLPFAKKLVTPMRALATAGLLFWVVCIWQNTGPFAWLLEHVLGKDPTFTNRLGIWASALAGFFQKPLFGHGVLSTLQYAEALGRSTATHCHNEYLQLLFDGGLAAFGLFLLALVRLFRQAAAVWPQKTCRIAIYGVVGFLVMGISEPLNYSQMQVILVLASIVVQREQDTRKNKKRAEGLTPDEHRRIGSCRIYRHKSDHRTCRGA